MWNLNKPKFFQLAILPNTSVHREFVQQASSVDTFGRIERWLRVHREGLMPQALKLWTVDFCLFFEILNSWLFSCCKKLHSPLLKRIISNFPMLISHHRISTMVLQLMSHSGMSYNSTPALPPPSSLNVVPTQKRNWLLKQMLRFKSQRVVKLLELFQGQQFWKIWIWKRWNVYSPNYLRLLVY